MSRFIPILNNLINVAAAPTAIVGNTNTSNTDVSLNDRTIDGNMFIKYIRKDMQDNKQNYTYTQAIVFSIISQNSSKYEQYIQEALKNIYIQAPTINGIDKFITMYKEFIQQNLNFDVDSEEDLKKIDTFIQTFLTESQKTTDLTTDIQNNDKLKTMYNILKDIKPDISENYIKNYIYRKINNIDGQDLITYYNNIKDSKYDYLRDTTSLVTKILEGMNEEITDAKLFTDKIDELYNGYDKTEIEKYRLRKLNEKFNELLESDKKKIKEEIINLFNNYVNNGNKIDDLQKVIDEYKVYTEVDKDRKTVISKNLDTIKTNLIIEVNTDIKTLIENHQEYITYTQYNNLKNLTASNILKQSEVEKFLRKWNQPIQNIDNLELFKIGEPKISTTPTTQDKEWINIEFENDIINDIIKKQNLKTTTLWVNITWNDLKNKLQNMQEYIKTDSTWNSLNFYQTQIYLQDQSKLTNYNKLTYNTNNQTPEDTIFDIFNLIALVKDNTTDDKNLSIFHKYFKNIQLESHVSGKTTSPNGLITYTLHYTITNLDNSEKVEGDVEIKDIKDAEKEEQQKLENFSKVLTTLFTEKTLNNRPRFYGVELPTILNAAKLDQNTPVGDYTLGWTNIKELLGDLWDTNFDNTQDSPSGLLKYVYNKEDNAVDDPYAHNPLVDTDRSNIDLQPNKNGINLIKSSNGWEITIDWKLVSTQYCTLANNTYAPLITYDAPTPPTPLQIIKIEPYISKSVDKISKEISAYNQVTSKLIGDNGLTQEDWENYVKATMELNNNYKTSSQNIQLLDELNKLGKETENKIKELTYQLLMKIPNISGQIQPLLDQITKLSTDLVTAQTELTTLQNDPNSTDEQKQQAQANVDDIKSKLESVNTQLNTIKDNITKLISKAGEIENSDIDQDLKDDAMESISNYLKTSDLSATYKIQELIDSLKHPIPHKINLSIPMKYVLASLGGVISLLGIGTTVTTLRSIRTNKMIKSLGDESSIQLQKTRKSFILKIGMGLVALGIGAALLALIIPTLL